MRLWRRAKKPLPAPDPVVEENLHKVDEVIRELEETLEREAQEDPWVRALGMGRPPYARPGEDPK